MSERLSSWSRSGLTFDVRDEGPADGVPVVLLHGFPQDGTAWAAMLPHLHAAGLRTLTPDQRGYSPGARPAGRSAYRLTECALDIVALLDAAGLERAHVVGHDWGGAAAWMLGGRHGERLHTLTVLSTPHPKVVGRSLVRSTQGLRSWYMGFFQLPWLPETVLGRSLEPQLARSGLPRAAAAHYAARMAQPGALAGALGWYRALPWSLQDAVPRSRVPTTYVWGRKDFALGRHAAEATGDAVAAPYLFVELDAGHWLPEARPRECAQAVIDRVTALPA